MGNLKQAPQFKLPSPIINLFTDTADTNFARFESIKSKLACPAAFHGINKGEGGEKRGDGSKTPSATNR